MSSSSQLMERASRSIPGGVNSPVRAHRAVGGKPFFVESGLGALVRDVDGREYVDLIMAYGPLILGHRHPAVVRAVQDALQRGYSFGMPTPAEVDLAEAVKRAFPSIEKLRLVNSGTEATMSAVRVARAFTGRPKIVKFEGCYHGHADHLLVKAGSGAMTFGSPDSAGVPGEFAAHTLNLRYNDVGALAGAFERLGDEIAAVIVEPFVGNMGVVRPTDEFVEALRTLPAANGALLIFDEVMTGFRVSFGGAQELLGVKPDLTCLGKIIGGGLPVGAYGGRADVMDLVAPLGPVYQAGTLSGNPLSVAAGLATLGVLERDPPYEALEGTCRTLRDGLLDAADEAGVPVRIQSVGSMFTVFFTREPVRDFQGAGACDTRAFAAFFGAMLDSGVAWPPSQFEAAFLSTAHGEREIGRILEAAPAAFAAAKEASGE